MQLVVKNLELGYDGKTIAKNISFSVDAGDYLCIVGENGTGKSTLLKAVLKLHKQVSGEITFNVARTEVGYLPQQDDIQRDFPASVKEIVMSGCLNQCKWWNPFYTKKERERVMQAIEKVNMTAFAKRCYGAKRSNTSVTTCYRELSGGQQQRVLLARALVAAQKMIFLDEPIAGLDPNATQEMYKAINAINKDGMTIVMVSHDVETATKYASHILHIGKDKCFFGKVDEYKVGKLK